MYVAWQLVSVGVYPYTRMCFVQCVLIYLFYPMRVCLCLYVAFQCMYVHRGACSRGRMLAVYAAGQQPLCFPLYAELAELLLYRN